jgi:hypothetical protein
MLREVEIDPSSDFVAREPRLVHYEQHVPISSEFSEKVSQATTICCQQSFDRFHSFVLR